jgi:hypothetical protein
MSASLRSACRGQPVFVVLGWCRELQSSASIMPWVPRADPSKTNPCVSELCGQLLKKDVISSHLFSFSFFLSKLTTLSFLCFQFSLMFFIASTQPCRARKVQYLSRIFEPPTLWLAW